MKLKESVGILAAQIQNIAAIVQNEDVEVVQEDLDTFGAATRYVQGHLQEMDYELDTLWSDVYNYLEQREVFSKINQISTQDVPQKYEEVFINNIEDILE
jgi:hypothetical protein